MILWYNVSVHVSNQISKYGFGTCTECNMKISIKSFSFNFVFHLFFYFLFIHFLSIFFFYSFIFYYYLFIFAKKEHGPESILIETSS